MVLIFNARDTQTLHAMNNDQVIDILEQTKERFLENEVSLLASDANERSLTHKFAEHMQTIIGREWSIDCEYNRFGSDPKKIDELKRIVGENTTTYETKPRTVYPDIIVHRRGEQGPNLLVVEAKKDATAKERELDIAKLKVIQSTYNYSFAVFIDFKIKFKDIEMSFIEV